MIKKEEHRRITALVLAHFGWWGSAALVSLIIFLGGQKPIGDAPPWLGLCAIILMGVGIAAGSALSRMRLARTIEHALEQGYRIGRENGHSQPVIGEYNKE